MKRLAEDGQFSLLDGAGCGFVSASSLPGRGFVEVIMVAGHHDKGMVQAGKKGAGGTVFLRSAVFVANIANSDDQIDIAPAVDGLAHLFFVGEMLAGQVRITKDNKMVKIFFYIRARLSEGGECHTEGKQEDDQNWAAKDEFWHDMSDGVLG